MENRQAINIVHCDYLIIHFNQSGQLDIAKHAHGSALKFRTIDLLNNFNNITYMQPVITKKQYMKDFTWQASQQQINAIVRHIFSSK